jgi:hypothetical protein
VGVLVPDALALEDEVTDGMPHTLPAKWAAVNGAAGVVGVTGTGLGAGLWKEAPPNERAEGSVRAINDTTLMVLPRPICARGQTKTQLCALPLTSSARIAPRHSVGSLRVSFCVTILYHVGRPLESLRVVQSEDARLLGALSSFSRSSRNVSASF